MNYYNEFDEFAAQWLRNLISKGLIPDGHVDTRSICDVQATDLVGYRQCHFFAGIGGWPLALRLAGIADDENIWTGSCPCQPFSVAGRQKGQADERHLWPVFSNLIRQHNPEWTFGEQVSAAIRLGWVDGVQTDMENAGNSFGYLVCGAHSVGAPHIRQRLFWGARRVSDAGSTASERNPGGFPSTQARVSGSRKLDGNHSVGFEHGCTDVHGIPDAQDFGASEDVRTGRIESDSVRNSSGILDSNSDRPFEGRIATAIDRHGDSADTTGSGLQHAESYGRNARGTESIGGSVASGCCGLRDTIDAGLQGYSGHVDNGDQSGWIGTDSQRSIAASDPWPDYTIGHYRDGKARRIGRGVFPLAHGIPRSMGRGEPELRQLAKRARGNRTGRLKGYGNAIVPQVAAVFVQAFMDQFN